MDAFKKLFISKPKTRRQTPSQSQPRDIVVVLRYSRHCKHCSLEVKRTCEKTKGVKDVYLDDTRALIMVEGAFDVDRLVKRIRRRNEKIVTIVEQRTAGENTEEAGSSSSIRTSYRGGYESSDDDIEIIHRCH